MSKVSIFISYGRKDSVSFATQLERDLTDRGHTVWRDQTALGSRAGVDWMAGIMQGIKQCDVVIALLTQHSVRGSADLTATADSVCLDELAAARFGEPPKPIVPVKLESCEPPLIIWRLQTIDVSDKYGDAAYQTALAAIIAALDPSRAAPTDRRFPQAAEFDFASYIGFKTRNFFGRHWLFKEIRQWLSDPHGSPCSIIVGDPGIGKTAILAELMIRNPMNAICGAYFCRSDQPETLNAMSFVAHIDAVLSTQIPGYGNREIEFNNRGSAALAFAEVVVAKLNRVQPKPTTPKVFLVDALDESLLDRSMSDTIPNLIGRAQSSLPDWFRLLMSSRKDEVVLGRLRELKPRFIDAGSTENAADLNGYVEVRLRSPELRVVFGEDEKSLWEIKQSIQNQASGNFLYASQLLDDLQSGHSSVEEISKLPPSLMGLYRHFFDRKFANIGRYEIFRQMFSIMLVADFTFTADDLAKILGLSDGEDLLENIKMIDEYVLTSENNGKIYLRPFHKSLTDWLSAGDHPYRIDAAVGHRRIATSITSYPDITILKRLTLGELCRHFARANLLPNLLEVLRRPATWFAIYCLENSPGIGSAFGINDKASEIVSLSLTGEDIEIGITIVLLVLDGLAESADRVRRQHLWKYLEPIYRRGGSIETFRFALEAKQELAGSMGLMVSILDAAGRLLRDAWGKPLDIAVSKGIITRIGTVPAALKKLQGGCEMLNLFSFYNVHRNYSMSGAYEDTAWCVDKDFTEISGDVVRHIQRVSDALAADHSDSVSPSG